RGRHHRACRRRFRLARRGHGSRRDRTACDLCPRHLSGIALLGARAGPQAAHLRNPGARRDRQRRRQRLVRQGEVGRHPSGIFARCVAPTLVALFVACCSTCIFGTVGGWMPLYLATEKHWSTTEYSLFYVFWGISGFLGLCVAGWLADRI